MRIAFAGHELDLLRHELRRGGEVVHVEPQVFDLLLHLIRNRDRVVSKDELLDAIWSGRIVSEAALSSRINAARKAVGDDGDRQALIRTIHKRGFRFVGEVQEQNGPSGEAVRSAEAGGEEGGVRPAVAAVMAVRRDAPSDAGGRKPSVVVIPFTNLSQEPDTEYFSYGLTEDVIRLLARNRWLEVLSRHSAAAFRGREVEPRAVGAALGVRYLVQGSVLKRGEHLRIAADLVCAETGRQLWSESYDLGLADILQIQQAMAQQIAAVIEPELARLEREAAIRKPPGNLDAWDCYQRGLWNLWGFTVPGLAEAEVMFRRAIELDAGFARAHGALSYVYLQSAVLRGPEERQALLDAALHYARKAVALDDGDCMNFCVLGRAHVMHRNHAEGIAALEKAIQLNPSFAQGYFALGHAMLWCGREEEAIALLERATELSPRDPHLSTFHDLRAMAHFALGELDEAAAFGREAVRLPNASYRAFATLVAALGLLGRPEEARPWREELLRRMPGYSCAYALGEFFFGANDALVERFVAGLREAGVPEGRPEAAEAAPSAAAPRRGGRAAAHGSQPPASRRSTV